MNIGMLKKITGYSFCDDVYKFAASSAEEAVKNYCNIDEIPEGLEYTTLKIAADILRREQYGSGDIPVVVNNVRVGDTSTSFTPLSDSETDEVIAKYKNTLNRYRRVTFV